MRATKPLLLIKMTYQSDITTFLLRLFSLHIYDAILLRKMSIVASISVLIAPYMFTRWTYYRYFGPMRSATIARTKSFWISKIGAVPPPSDKEVTDELSSFLIQCGQDPTQQPWSVCWSIFGTPLVILNNLQSIKDVLIDAQLKKNKEGRGAAERGQLINKIQNIVFGGKNINNTVGEVCIAFSS